MQLLLRFCKKRLLLRTVRVISSDPPCNDGNFQFTSVPLKALSDQLSVFKIINIGIKFILDQSKL